MTKHTPGPWKQHAFRVYFGEMEGGLARTVADCNFNRIRQNPLAMDDNAAFFEASYNARLIAAAPELLACVEVWLEQMRQDNAPQDSAQFRMASEAIAKAKGTT